MKRLNCQHAGAILTAAVSTAMFFAFSAGALEQDPDIKPENIKAAEYSAVRDRLSVSMFLRGELADKIMAAGLENRLLGTRAGKTHSEVREALIGWIEKNPVRAVNLYFYLAGDAASSEVRKEITYTTSQWVLNRKFLRLAGSLKTAALDKGVSDEALNLTSSGLFEDRPERAGGVAISGWRSGVSKTGAGEGYADYKLNRAGLERELEGLQTWTDALRADFERALSPSPARRRLFKKVFSGYDAFKMSASALRMRSAITYSESLSLEKERRALRGALAALTLLELSGRVGEEASGLDARQALAAEARELAAGLEELAAGFEAQAAGLGDAGAILQAAGRACGIFCGRASSARALLKLRERLGAAGFSCLYDYLFFTALGKFFPTADYVRARRGLYGGEVLLERAMSVLMRGDTGENISAEISALDERLSAVERCSFLNRRAQFFLWGIAFRPVELEVFSLRGLANFRPVVTFFAVAPGR